MLLELELGEGLAMRGLREGHVSTSPGSRSFNQRIEPGPRLSLDNVSGNTGSLGSLNRSLHESSSQKSSSVAPLAVAAKDTAVQAAQVSSSSEPVAIPSSVQAAWNNAGWMSGVGMAGSAGRIWGTVVAGGTGTMTSAVGANDLASSLPVSSMYSSATSADESVPAAGSGTEFPYASASQVIGAAWHQHQLKQLRSSAATTAVAAQWGGFTSANLSQPACALPTQEEALLSGELRSSNGSISTGNSGGSNIGGRFGYVDLGGARWGALVEAPSAVPKLTDPAPEPPPGHPQSITPLLMGSNVDNSTGLLSSWKPLVSSSLQQQHRQLMASNGLVGSHGALPDDLSVSRGSGGRVDSAEGEVLQLGGIVAGGGGHRICRYFLAGGCRDGDRCRFSHPPSLQHHLPPMGAATTGGFGSFQTNGGGDAHIGPAASLNVFAPKASFQRSNAYNAFDSMEVEPWAHNQQGGVRGGGHIWGSGGGGDDGEGYEGYDSLVAGSEEYKLAQFGGDEGGQLHEGPIPPCAMLPDELTFSPTASPTSAFARQQQLQQHQA